MSFMYVYADKGGIVSCVVNGARRYSADLIQGSLEVPYHSVSYFCSLSLLTYIFGIHHVRVALWVPLVSAAFLAL